MAAGKSAVGTLLAARLGYRFIDTGVMYRAITWAALKDGLDPEDESSVTALAERSMIEVTEGDASGMSRIIVNGHDVTGVLRTKDVEQGCFPGLAFYRRTFSDGGPPAGSCR